MKKISIGIELNNKPTKVRNNLHNILIRVTKDRVSKRFSTDFYINPKHWTAKEKLVAGGRRGDLQASFINDSLEDLLSRTRVWLNDQKKEGVDLSVQDVTDFLAGNYDPDKATETGTESNDFFEFCKVYLARKKMLSQDLFLAVNSRIKNFREYCALKGLKVLPFSEIDANLLHGFQDYVKQKGKGRKTTTVNYNLNCIKEVLQLAMNYHEDVRPEVFYKVKSLRGTKSKAKEKLTSEEIHLMETAEVDNFDERTALDIFLFSYYTVGARIRDSLTMRYRNIESGITYTMSKNKKVIVVEDHEKLQKLLKPYMEKPHKESDFIFPYLDNQEFSKASVEERVHMIMNRTSRVNYYLRKATKKLGINKNVTTHIARHTFALHYFEKTGDLKGTSELLAHGSLSTTDRYLRQHGAINNSKKAKGFYDRD